ncbi:MAG TPA: GTPase domain-containing protein [Tepidisphaeraceae bacterium]|nr:GTPase domain-containing protein [Tepidisphaeraceae bacterium]
MEQLVHEVTDLTGSAAPDVFDQDAPVLRAETVADEGFYLVGLIGGKEVGKSALVNALAGQIIAESTSYGRGTEAVLAYAHVSQADAVTELLRREVPGKFRVITHELPHLTRQVLLDLPDIDSHYADHIEVTRRMLRHMLFPVWIQSVEKYADRQPQQLLAAVAAGNDPANFIFVLNKADQVVDKAGELTALELRHDFAQRLARTLSMSPPPTVHMISAIHPERYDLPTLRELLAQQKSTEIVRQSLDLAGRQRTRSLLSWLDAQNLPARADRLKRLQEEAEELTASRLGVPIIEDALPRLLDDPAHRLALVDEVMSRRVARWPLVNVLHALFAPLTAMWRRNATIAAQPAAESLVQLYLDAGDRPLSVRVQTTFAMLHQSHPAVAALYRHRRLWDDMAADEVSADLRAALSSALQRQREAALQQLAGGHGVIRPFFRVLLTVGAVLWFPIIQPLLEAMLQSGAARTTQELLLLGVQLLGTTYLLKNAMFLLIWFAVLWLLIRWDTQRRVNRLLLRWRGTDANDPSVNLATATLEWIDGLIEPIRTARARADALVQRTEQLRASLAA